MHTNNIHNAITSYDTPFGGISYNSTTNFQWLVLLLA